MTDLVRSWIETANDPESPFPLNNLPFGVFSAGDAPRCATAIGDKVLDLAALQKAGLLPDHGFDEPALNTFMGEGKQAWNEVREKLTDLLRDGAETDAVRDALHDMGNVTLHLPFTVIEYTDFYAGRQHAFNVGSLFRDPANALPPNWLHIPIGYNGRASTVVVSGTEFHRPMGQLKGPQDDQPRFGPSQRLDIELEMGAVVGMPTEMGQRISVDQADDMIFGYVLLNDWSARDIQAWEYQPLGPFQAKAFATTISPWVVTKAALEPFRCDTPPREKELLPHIKDTGPMLYDIDLSVTMTAPGAEPTEICRTNYNALYYSAAQQLAHHASSGCAMRTGDLLGSGTISGPEKGTFGSLLEMTWGGKNPITLEGGATRTFIEDGDTLALHGHAQGDGYRVGFGPCVGTVLPERADRS
ncbi:fumarylacetoacetase [Pacificitalea manganoxidans]|uniref:fumarylacetoacetase n=1 Tax=Pacificitalea manganoxidans TaxID=1411902 RepID=A0A291LYR7_9RHOB|nr:fumarylacetoacetase [Pacificitalea manganoxidans]ATI41794.1 fumarylacetoacetase [Pacificitalea manganoxidans]MDR6309260.1 fumarylacetoacetase [Pacificitalea manganoxidans]